MNLLTQLHQVDTITAAKLLLGRVLVRYLDGQRVSGRIVETEAYLGEKDVVSHASRGKTQRNEVMYGPPAHVYVYFTYGMHYCMNIVTEAENTAGAVLIRALEPLEGIDIMQQNRGFGGSSLETLANGPAKLCQALAIDLAFNGHDLSKPPLQIESGSAPTKIEQTTRIGVREVKPSPLRFYINANQYVSVINK